MMEIRKALVTLLHIGDVFLKCLMEFIKVSNKISDPSGYDVMIRVNKDGRVVVLIGVEE